MAEPDYTFRAGIPPAKPRQNQPSPLSDNMFKVAESPERSGLIATYTNGNSASAVVSELRSGKKGARRPAGTWEFRSVPTGDGKYEIWAQFTPPT